MRLLLIAALLGLSACATSYQPIGWSGGYEDVELGQDRYLVNFEGNGYTRPTTTQQYAVRRAKELCAERNMDFEILQVGGDVSQFQGAASSSCNGGAYGSIHCTHQPGAVIRKPTAKVVVQCNRKPASASN